MKTFTQWHKENAKYMKPQDIVAWCAEAWIAGYDLAVAIQQEKSETLTDENLPEIFK